MSEIETYLNNLRKVPFGKRHLTETYLILDSELKRLGGVLVLMKLKIPDSENYQIDLLEAIIQNLHLLRDFAKESGQE